MLPTTDSLQQVLVLQLSHDIVEESVGGVVEAQAVSTEGFYTETFRHSTTATTFNNQYHLNPNEREVGGCYTGNYQDRYFVNNDSNDKLLTGGGRDYFILRTEV